MIIDLHVYFENNMRIFTRALIMTYYFDFDANRHHLSLNSVIDQATSYLVIDWAFFSRHKNLKVEYFCQDQWC